MRRNLKNTYISSVDYAQAKANGINKETLRSRIWNYRWDKEKAKTEPVKEKDYSNSKWIKLAVKNGVNRNTFYSRLNLGWSAEKAATTPTGHRGRPRKEK